MPCRLATQVLFLAIFVACRADDAPEPELHALDKEDARREVQPVAQSPRTERSQLRDAQELVIDMAAQQACRALENRIMTLGGTPGQPVEGRMWLRRCEGSVREEHLELELGAWAWTWVDERTGAAGATFALRQYVFLGANVTLRAMPELRYDRAGHYAFLWLRPIEDPQVRTSTLGDLETTPRGAWSHIVGAVVDLFGASTDERAREVVDREGDRRFEQTIDEGFTVYADLCTGKVSMEMGRLSEPAHPRTRRGRPGRATLIRVHPGGLDAHGPIAGGGDEMIVRMRVTAGGPARARLVCQADAVRMLEAFQRGARLPEFDAVADARASREQPGELRGGGRAACPLYLITTPANDAATTASFTVQPADEVRRALVPGCR